MSARLSAAGLHGAEESVLLPLYSRALESGRERPILHDARAVQLVEALDYDFGRLDAARLYHAIVCLRARRFDALVAEFLARQPDGVIVNFGCGLDTRAERVDNGRAVWLDVDLPAVLELRARLLGVAPRHQALVSDDGLRWMDGLGAYRRRAVLLVAEGVLMFLEPEHVRRLVGALFECAPSAELAFDAVKPLELWAQRFHPTLAGTRARLRFGLWSASRLTRWQPPLEVLGEWFYCDEREPRLGRYRWLRVVRRLACTAFIVHAARATADTAARASRRAGR